MAREFAKIFTRVWQDADFRSLTHTEQWLYLHLITRPDLSYAGVCDWRPKRISAQADGINAQQVEFAAAVLMAKGCIVTDDETEELLVRSYQRNDGFLSGSWKNGVAVTKAHNMIISPTVAGVHVHELQRLQSDYPTWKGFAGLEEVLGRTGVDPGTLRVDAVQLPPPTVFADSTPPF